MGAFDPRPEPVRPVSARDAGGYVEDLGVQPGDAVRFAFNRNAHGSGPVLDPAGKPGVARVSEQGRPEADALHHPREIVYLA